MKRIINDTALVEDLAFLVDNGVGATEAARRTGFTTADALDRWLYRHDQRDLAARLWRQDYASVTPSRKEHHLGGRRAS